VTRAPQATRTDDRPMLGVALLAGTANVIMQLARPEVGYGVIESPVESGSVFRHPYKRTRTTLTYLVVAMRGSDEERRAYRMAVNRSHAQVKSGPDSPVQYDAFDPDLQLWVAACLYRGIEDTHEAFLGELDDVTRDELYAEASTLGTTLQVPEDLWPPDRASFEEYWQQSLEKVEIDDTVRGYLNDLIELRFAHQPLRSLMAPVHRFMTTGFLSPRFRQEMRLRWTPRQQRRFLRVTRTIGAIVQRLPRAVQEFPFNLYLCDVRARMRRGRRLV
jgi:uncharacterized protein (DUF2236 family)